MARRIRSPRSGAAADPPMYRVVSRLAVLFTLLALALVAAGTAPSPTAARIVGGTNVAPGEHPWQVAMIGKDDSGNDVQYCGGTLVDEEWVLTAAHCDVWTVDKVRVGSINRSSGGELIGVAEVKNHPLADGWSDPPRHDVTMVRLDDPVTDPKPLAIVTPGSDDPLWATGVLLTASGWGATSQGGSSSQTLKDVQVPRVSDASCAGSYPNEFSSTDMVCAGYPQGGKDTCQGDSGGPLIAAVGDAPDKSDPADWRLVGGTSWGIGCAQEDRPGVYARLGNPLLGDWTSLTPPVAATPALTGGAKVGETVSCARGTWTGGTAYFRSHFYRQSGSAPAVLDASTTSNTYTLRPVDAGHTVFCRVRGENAAATVESGQSNATGPIEAAPVPTSTRPPAIAGDPVTGRELRCEPGAWNGATSLTYAFRRRAADGTTTPVGTGSTYVPTGADLGFELVCVETARNAGGSAEAVSSPVGPVTAPDPPFTPGPDPRPEPEPGPEPEQPPAADTRRPRAVVAARRCVARRCTIRTTVSDPAPSSGARSVMAKLTYRVRGRCRGRVCLRTVRRTIQAVRLGSLFVVRTPRLPVGRWTVRLVAADNAGNAQGVPTVARLRVR